MNKLFTDEAWDDYQFWINTDKKQLKRINSLMKDIDRNPRKGIGNFNQAIQPPSFRLLLPAWEFAASLRLV
jgi:Txe/YoeB family toxin of Txe-Axe toxin-antitoxin module